ncbi:MAG TPA: NAD(P)/FAD-dependent oxidoreductase [Terriglobales bacterium]
MENVDVVIVGSSVAGLMTAAYLKQQLPILEVIVLGPRQEDERRPMVGESLVEPAALFMQEIGLGDYLNSTQMTKNGLTFYHKIKPEDPLDRRYSVHAPHRLHYTAWQLNRPDVDRALRGRAAELGVRLVTGRMNDCEIGTTATGHRVHARVGESDVTFSCRWLIDATGRARRIGKKVTTYIRPQARQRSCFWFRLADFEPFSPHIEMAMRRSPAYDLWETTHHFLGQGYWIWGIPLARHGGRRLISIGITFRPDIFPHPVRGIEDFLTVVDQQHPALGTMVRSGRVLDTNAYHEYLYWSDKVYSADGWFLVGDAARAVDPLYSNGLSLTTVQVQQIGAILQRQRDGVLSPGDVEAMDTAWRRFMAREQADISQYYEVMQDPFQACMRRYWNVCGWFNAFLPMWWNGFFSVPLAARLFIRFFQEHDPAVESAWKLFAHVAKALGPEPAPADFARVPELDWMINLRFDCPAEEIPGHLARTFWKRIRMRLALLRMERYRHVLEQLPALAREMASIFILRCLFPWIGRQAFAALKPPLPRCAAISSRTDSAQADVRQPSGQAILRAPVENRL